MPKGLVKDNSRTSQASRQESIKDSNDISNILSILDSVSIRTTPFGANISGENSYRRAERISAALHVITSHVPENEPLRTVIREKGIDLLSLILDVRAGFRGATSDKSQTVLATIRELISLVRLLAVSGFVSVQNAQTIAEAIDELGSLIVVSQRSTLAEQLTISHDLLIPPPPAFAPRTERTHTGSPRTVAKRTSSESEEKTAAPSEGEGSYRSNQILEMLKVGGVLGIKDISSNLPQYSEKMIQRELADLVERGKVLKIGEKRWSKYRYVQ